MLEGDLATGVVDFAAALKIVVAGQPHYVSRSGRAYQPGIGPFAEDVAVDLITCEMKTARPGVYDTMNCQVAYFGSKQKCDLVIDGTVPLHIEIKSRERNRGARLDSPALVQLAEGAAPFAVLVPIRVAGTQVELTIAASGPYDGLTFTGTVTRSELTGKWSSGSVFAGAGDREGMKRGKSYWQ